MAGVAVVVATVVVAYLLGSLSGSLLVGRLRGVDIRTQGSGNAGGTNALRTQGWTFALAVVVIDIGKGALAAALPWLVPITTPFAPLPLALATSLAAMLGHRYPVFFGFRGGKGAATLVGALAVVLPIAVVPVFLLWLVIVLVTGYVGLATIVAALSMPLVCAAFAPDAWRIEIIAFALIAAVFIVYTHRDNVARLRAGTEHRFERARILAKAWRGRRPP
jgi:acyl phosphate:glycerol-3-phosphate acyltransferase